MATGELRFRKETKKNIILNMMRYSITETDESSKLNTLAMKMLYYFFYLFNQEDISDDAEEYKVKALLMNFLN